MAAPALQKVDFNKLTPRDTTVLVISILAILGFGWYKFEYLRLEEKKAQTEKQLRNVEDLIASFQQTILNPAQMRQTEEAIVKIRQDILDIRAEMSAIKDRMSAKSVNILQQLKNTAGNQEGAVLRSFKTSEKKITKGQFTYREISITMKIQSEYNSLTSLIGKFENVPEFLSLKSLETERVEDILPLVETLLQFELLVF